MSTKRGRPIFKNDDIPILKYEQHFEDIDGTKYTWVFDKEIYPNGVKSVTISDPKYNYSEKLLKELETINKKYISNGISRKPRVTKVDKERIEEINKNLDDFYYSLYPDERPKPRINAKTKKTKIR